MAHFRTTARGFLLLALFGLLAGTAAARPPDPFKRVVKAPSQKPKPAGKQIVFPVIGAAKLTNSFGDARGQGAHQGEDLMSARWAVAVAAEPGRIRFHTGSGRAGCMLYLYGTSGWKYLYIHLNNDLTNRNDNRGGCVNGVAFPKGLKDGQRVAAGQPIGFVGDSGDADGIQPHLHFEMHRPGGSAVAPYPYLKTAKRLLFHAPAGSFFTLEMRGKVVAVGPQALRLKVLILRASTMNRPLTNVERAVLVTVPIDALVERPTRTPGITAPARLATAKAGEAVSVWTELTLSTPAAQTGKDGVLAAERVLLPAA